MEQSPNEVLAHNLMPNISALLKSNSLLGKGPDSIDRINSMARHMLNADMAGIYLFTSEGIVKDSLSRDEKVDKSAIASFTQLCKKVVKDKKLIYFADILQNENKRLSTEPSNHRPTSIKGFAGVPLFLRDGLVIGVLGVGMMNKWQWQEIDRIHLEELALMTVRELQLMVQVIERKEVEKLVKEVTKIAKIGIWIYDIKSGHISLSERANDIHGLDISKLYSLKQLLALYPLKYRYELFRAYKKLLEDHQPFERTSHIIKPNNERAWISVSGECEIQNNEVIRVKGAVQDISRSKRFENRISNYAGSLNVLNTIFSTSGLSFDEQLNKALDYVTSFLNLPIGIISHIKDKTYQIEYLANHDYNINLKKNEIYEFECDLTHSRNQLVETSDVHDSAYKNHPFFIKFPIGTYVELPIEVDGQIYGTLNFSSLEPQQRPLSDYEKEFVQLFGKWVGALIERRNAKQDLEKTLNELSDYKHALDVSSILELTDQEGSLIYVNDKFTETTGYSKEEVMGSKHKQVHINSGYHPHSYFDDLWSTIAKGRVWKGEIRNRAKDGSYFWVYKTIIPFLDEQKKPYQYISVDHDITSIKQAEKALKDSEQRFRGIFESAAVGIILVNNEGIILRSNQAFEDMLGYEAIELKGRNIEEISYPKDVQEYRQAFSDLISGKQKKLQIQKRYIKKNGEVIWGRLTSSIIRNSENKDTYAIDMVEDITSQKEMETALRDRERQYRDLFENAVEGIYQSSKDGRLLTANPSMATILGFESPQELLKTIDNVTYQIYVNETDRLRLIELLEKEKEVKNFQAELIKKDGSKIWVSISTRYLRDKMGVEYMEGTIQDITQQKISERQLQEAKELAEKANRAKSEFLANVSHEIRTPMNAVLGFTDILTDIEKDPQKRQYLEAINTSGKNLLNLINDILDLSKIEAGHLKLEYHAVNLVLLLDEINKIFSQKVKEKGLHFEAHVDEHVPQSIIIDEIRIRQVLLNLVGNAIKFTDQGSISVLIKLNSSFPHESDKVSIRIEVSDTGIGIPKDQQDLIFESFQQQSGQSNRKYGGTGLGLTISRRLIEKMGGELTLTSEPNVGSTFTVNLSNLDIATFDDSFHEDSLNTVSMVFKKALVLVVDDVKLNNALITEYLKSTGLKTIEAENGQEAIDLTRKYRPDAILMDLKMPVMDGFEATKILKSDSSTSTIPILAITASILQTQSNSYEREIFDGFLEKPIRKNSLINELSRFLKYKGSYSTKKSVSSHYNNGQSLENNGSYIISEELIKHKDQIIHHLEGNVWEKWEDLKETIIIGNVQYFIDDLSKINQVYNTDFFDKYIDNLQYALNNFDVIKISSLLSDYPDIVVNFKESL